MHSIMASLNLGQDKIDSCCSYCGQSYPLYLTVKMCRYGSLININLSPLCIRIYLTLFPYIPEKHTFIDFTKLEIFLLFL